MNKTASLKIERLPLSKLLPHPRNPRIHPEKGTPAWETLRKSLEADYFDPIVVNSGKKEPKLKNVLVSGHLRVKVLRDLGFTEADCVVVDYDETTHLLRMIAANKLIGQDDIPSLQSLLSELDAGGMADMDLTGYDEGEIKNLITQYHQDEVPKENKTIDEGAMTDTKNECPKCGFKW